MNRKLALASALAVSATALPNEAFAADLPVYEPAPVVIDEPYLWRLTVEGGPVLDPWAPSAGPIDDDKFGGDGEGYYGSVALRRLLKSHPGWDVKGTLSYTHTDKDGLWDGGDGDAEMAAELSYHTVDVDFGFRPHGPEKDFRVFAGIRFLHADNSYFYDDDEGPEINLDADLFGVGPRIGFEGEHRMSDKWGIFAGLSGAFLFSSYDLDGEDGGPISDSDDVIVGNVEGSAGLTWHFGESHALSLGYRVQYLSNVRQAVYWDADTTDALIHGPILRLDWDF